jgi:hypothetical protein
MDSESRPESKPASSEGRSAAPAVGGLTTEILERFREEVLKTGQFNEGLVGKLLALATGEAKPKAKDFEALLLEEEPLE